MGKTVFHTMKNLYANYVKQEGEAQEILKKSMLSGDYSQKKLNEMQKGFNDADIHNRQVLEGQFKTLRDQYEKELLLADDFTSLSNTDSAMLTPLVRILQSGIDFTPKEYERMAAKHLNYRVCSRVLHDDAKRHGYDLCNMSDCDTKLAEFDRVADRLLKAADKKGDNITRTMLADIDPDEITSKLENPTCACLPIGNDMASIAQAVQREMMVSSGGGVSLAQAEAAFLKGFVGSDKAKELETIEKEASDSEKLRFDSSDTAVQVVAMQCAKMKTLYPTLNDALDAAEHVVNDLATAKDNG